MSEWAIGWVEIAIALFWRLAPQGIVFDRKDMGRLPYDRVLIEDRTEREIKFSWATVEDAQKLRDHWPIGGGDKPGVSELQGRWQKIAVVLLWKCAKDGLTLTPADRAAVPSHLTLYTEGHADDVLFRFMPRDEAERLRKWYEFNEGQHILEKTS